MSKERFLDYLSTELKEYQRLPLHSHACLAKKEFIQGMMTSAKFFGVSYQELELVIQAQEHLHHEPPFDHNSPEYWDYIDTPTYMRQQMRRS